MGDNSSKKPDNPPAPEHHQSEEVLLKLSDELLTKLNKKGKLQLTKSQVQEFIVESHHQGPLPSPGQLVAYNNAIPNAAERILAMAEREQAHMHEIESMQIKGWQESNKKIIDIESRNSLLGILSAFLISLVAIGGGFYVISLGSVGSQIAGGLISFTGLTSLVGTFIYGSRDKNNKKLTNKEIKKNK